MKTTIIHGDHFEKSYEYFANLVDGSRSKGFEIVTLSPKKNIREDLRASTLFADKRVFVLEDPKQLVKTDLEWLKKNLDGIEGYLLVYSKTDLGKTIIDKFGKAEVKVFTLPKLIFKFLDSFYPRNSTACLKILHELVQNESVELVFAMLGRHLRDLYWTKIDSKSVLYPPWRVERLKSSSSKFANGQLERIIAKVAQADVAAKTGMSPLISSLDMIIIKELE